MIIDIERLLTLIAARPKIRTVEIAEILDCEPGEVRLALQRYVDDGTIAAHPIKAPNGNSIYEFEVISQATILTDAKRAAALRNAPGVDIDRVTTKIGRAIDFITERGSATSGQLHGVMGLTYGRTVSTALSGPLKDGRVARKGALWVVGPNPKGVKPAAKAGPAAKPSPIMTGPAPHRGGAPKLEPDSMVASVNAVPDGPFACAIWSDGSMELRRDGHQLALLTTTEQSTLAKMLQQGAR